MSANFVIGSARAARTSIALVFAAATIAAANAASLRDVRAPLARHSARAGVDLNVRLQTAHAFTPLHFFTGGSGGNAPDGGLDLAISFAGNQFTSSVYGVTTFGVSATGASDNLGTVYNYQLQSGIFSAIHAFAGADGAAPNDGPDNNFTDYLAAGGPQIGTTTRGGAYGYGTLYAFTPRGHVTVLHSFTNGADGGNPIGRMTSFTDGNFYGTTSAGGAYGFGTIFRYSPKTRAFATIHAFGRGTEGRNPRALSVRVVRSSVPFKRPMTPQEYAKIVRGITFDNVLYGVTYAGGANGYGTLFSIAPNGAFKTIHSFAFADGTTPDAGLTPDLNGNLYGTTLGGGSSAIGTVFVLRRNNTFALVHDFQAGLTDFPEGASPDAPITLGFDGALYGTTYTGGDFNGSGVIFQIASGVFSVIHYLSFPEGSGPQGKLVDGFDGYLYGTTTGGGPSPSFDGSGNGTLFKIAE